MEKMNIDAIRYLASIAEVANIIKIKLENEEALVNPEQYKEIKDIDDKLDTLHFSLFE